MAAQAMAQERGVAEFSYRDLADVVGIRAASIHHHFPRKDDLLTEVAARYRQEFGEQLAELRSQPSGELRLVGYRDLFLRVANEGSMCLCGSAAAEWTSIGASTRLEVQAFFAEQRAWLSDVIGEAVATGEFASSIDSQEEADVILVALEGATLLSRAEVSPTLVDSVFNGLLARIVRGVRR